MLIQKFGDSKMIYSSQHLKWIKNVHQSCPKTRTRFGFGTTLMKGFDPLLMLTTVYTNTKDWIFFFQKGCIKFSFASQEYI